jgi:hypothetical protein
VSHSTSLKIEEFSEMLQSNPQLREMRMNIKIKHGRVRPANEVIKAMAAIYGKPIPDKGQMVLYTLEEE